MVSSRLEDGDALAHMATAIVNEPLLESHGDGSLNRKRQVATRSPELPHQVNLRAQTVGLFISSIGIAASTAQFLHLDTVFSGKIALGAALLFAILAIGVRFLSSSSISSLWGAIGIFGALANMMNAPFIAHSDLMAYVETEPNRRQAMRLGMLAIGSVHALFPFSYRTEIGIAAWVFGCAIIQNAILYFRTGELSCACYECFGVIIPFSLGMIVTEITFRGRNRGTVINAAADPESYPLDSVSLGLA